MASSSLDNSSYVLSINSYCSTGIKTLFCISIVPFLVVFKNLQKDLQNKLRKIEEYRGERFIQKGLFFVLKGVVGYVADIGILQKQNNKIRLKIFFILLYYNCFLNPNVLVAAVFSVPKFESVNPFFFWSKVKTIHSNSCCLSTSSVNGVRISHHISF